MFKAFEVMSDLPDAVLAIAILDGTTETDELYNGARYVTMSDHRVVIVIPSRRGYLASIELFPNLNGIGAPTTKCLPHELRTSEDTEIAAMSHTRSIGTPLENRIGGNSLI